MRVTNRSFYFTKICGKNIKSVMELNGIRYQSGCGNKRDTKLKRKTGFLNTEYFHGKTSYSIPSINVYRMNIIISNKTKILIISLLV